MRKDLPIENVDKGKVECVTEESKTSKTAQTALDEPKLDSKDKETIWLRHSSHKLTALPYGTAALAFWDFTERGSA
ncbi:unnamed protein product [Toxocara canis]|uniref:Uncharacterized protein n=1 Tax=Toxocara canis TaxID=6265 RepID=A0A183VC31_TOXCA|nr:unnamed protein product [Toxocara canis]